MTHHYLLKKTTIGNLKTMFKLTLSIGDNSPRWYKTKMSDRVRDMLKTKEGIDKIREIGLSKDRGNIPCMHMSCSNCQGTGTNKLTGGMCVHGLSCPCPRCSPYSLHGFTNIT